MEHSNDIPMVLEKLEKNNIYLNNTGIVSYDEYEKNNNELKSYYDEITNIIKYIPELFIKRKTINSSHSSYGLKHILEDYVMKKYNKYGYCSNGVFIIAMFICGFKIKPIKNSYNVCFDVKLLKY
jgi:hypothetical protein